MEIKFALDGKSVAGLAVIAVAFAFVFHEAKEHIENKNKEPTENTKTE